MNKPERILAHPAYTVQNQTINSRKIGMFEAPLTAKLDFDDVFDGRNLCIANEIYGLIQETSCEVLRIAYLVKRGVRSTPDGWICEYRTKCMVVEINLPRVGQAAIPMPVRGKDGVSNTDFYSAFGKDSIVDARVDRDDMYSEFNESDFDITNDITWEVETEDDSGPDYNPESEDDRDLLEKFRIKRDDRKEVAESTARFIDTKRYYIFSSSVGNRIQVLWRKSEKIKHQHRYVDAVRELSTYAKPREFTSSRTCRVNRGGVKECYGKVRDWQRWHSESTA